MPDQFPEHVPGPGRGDTPVEALSATAKTTWTGRLTLPADAGAEAVESLSFAFQGEDALGNPGSRIQSPPSLQIYQGELGLSNKELERDWW